MNRNTSRIHGAEIYALVEIGCQSYSHGSTAWNNATTREIEVDTLDCVWTDCALTLALRCCSCCSRHDFSCGSTVSVVVAVITVKNYDIVVDIVSSEMVVLASMVVVVITVGDSEVVVDEYEVLSSALEGVSEMSELAGSDEVSEVEPKVEKLVSVDSFGVVVGRFDRPCPVDDEVLEDDDASVDNAASEDNDTSEDVDASADDVALVLDSFEKIDDPMVTNDLKGSEEITVDVTKSNACVFGIHPGGLAVNVMYT